MQPAGSRHQAELTVYRISTAVPDNDAVRVIGCDCGFEASEDGDGRLIERAQDHARRIHGMELPAELILALARGTPRGRVTRSEDNGNA